MKNWKSISLVLAMPLLLWACNAPAETEAPVETVEPPVAEPATTEIDLAPEAEVIPEETTQPEDLIEEVVEEVVEVVEPVVAPPAVEDEPEPEATGLNGEFTYSTAYATPKGPTTMDVTFAIENNVIRSVSLEGEPEHKTSLKYQALFEESIGALLVGKTIAAAEAAPDKLNGSSLTSTGFNDALLALQNG